MNLVDWSQVNEHLAQLARPTKVEGPIQYRYQAKTGQDLWNLSGRQSDAVDQANGDKVRMQQYILDLSHAVQRQEAPTCHFWQVKCRRAQSQSGS